MGQHQNVTDGTNELSFSTVMIVIRPIHTQLSAHKYCVYVIFRLMVIKFNDRTSLHEDVYCAANVQIKAI